MVFCVAINDFFFAAENQHHYAVFYGLLKTKKSRKVRFFLFFLWFLDIVFWYKLCA